MFQLSVGKKSGQDKNKNSAKFLDPKRDIHTRIRALYRLVEFHLEHETKKFFEDHYTEIFYVFYEEFTNLEVNAKSKGAKLKEELEELLALLEKIFIYLADTLHSLWQFNCIGFVLRKLLHHGNVLVIREIGVKLFMLWLLILQEKVDEVHLAVFASIVPGFPTPIEKLNINEEDQPRHAVEHVISCISGEGTFNSSFESDVEWCVAEGGNAICPPQHGDKVVPPEDLSKKFLDLLLNNMTSHILDIQWNETNMRERGLYHVFSHFKRFYLAEIFQLWNPIDRLYHCGNDVINVPISEFPDDEKGCSDTCGHTHLIKVQCQSSVIGWLIQYTSQCISNPKVKKASERANISICPDESDVKEIHVVESANEEEKLTECALIVQNVLYATRENVLVMHEIFRHGFLMPLSYSDIMIRILNIYNDWFFKVSEKPLFMLEPKTTCGGEHEHDDGGNVPVEHVQAGFHANLRLFIALSGQVFFIKQKKDIPSKHTNVCKKVTKHYRNIVLEKSLDTLTWRQLLIVLLKIIDHIFKVRPPSPRHSTLGGQLGSYLLQTLFVTWVRASLEVYLSLDLWDELLRVGSTFTSWEEMIREWAGTLETLTRVMARTLYGIDLNHPPLSQLTKRGNLKKIRKHSATHGNKPLDDVDAKGAKSFARSFSSGWSQWHEPVDSTVTEPTLCDISEGAEIQESRNTCGMVNQRKLCDNVMNVKNDEMAHEAGRQEEDIVGDILVLSGVEGTEPIDYWQCATGVSSWNSSQENFADFASHFPETNFDVNSDSEFGDSELSSTSGGSSVKNHIFYEALNDMDASSVSMPVTYNYENLSGLLSESIQNLLAEDTDSSDTSDNRDISAEDMFNEIMCRARCNVDDNHLERRASVGNISLDNDFNEEADGCFCLNKESDFCTKDYSYSETERYLSITEENTSLSNEGNYGTVHDEEKPVLTESGSYTGDCSDSNYKNFESDVMKSGTYSDSTSDTKSNDFLALDNLLSPNSSGLSGQDLVTLESNLKCAARQNADNQSIDSHMFTSLIDNENFTATTHANTTSDNEMEVGGAPIAEEDMEILEDAIANVHFDRSNAENDDATKLRESPDSMTLSVIEGGSEVGWTTVSSAILWNRMLGILGNINHIKDQEIHGLAFKSLTDLWLMLETIKSNLGISVDNKSTPEPSALTPPLYFCSTWCFEAMTVDHSSSHKQGRIRAFRLMCMMMIRNHGLTPPHVLTTHFFRLLHIGLTGPDQDVTNAIIAETALFYTREFEGSFCLCLDFIHATNTIICTQYMPYPRKEAISLLGSMICLTGVYPNIKIYQPGLQVNETQHTLTGKELRERILIPVLKAAKNDPSCRARCVALSCLGLYVIESLVHWNGDGRIYECLALVISSLDFHSQTVCDVAIDVLMALTFYHKQLAAFDKNLPLKVVEAISRTTVQLHSSQEISSSHLKPEDAPEYISKLLLCLLDWLMVVSQDDLLKTCADGEHTYFGMVTETFKRCCEQSTWHKFESKQRSLNINQIFLEGAQPIRLARVHHDLSMDDMQGITDDEETDAFFQPEQSNRDASILPITAKYCIHQLLNYYGYFPFDTGAVQPVSVVIEMDDYDDNNTISAANQNKLLSCDNVQLILLNGTTVLSVAELPQVEEFNGTCVQNVTRFILRDISGKYCWDVAGLFTISESDAPDNGCTVPKQKGCIERRKHSRNLSVSIPRPTSCSTELPTWKTVDANVDRVDQLLRYIGFASPECLLYSNQQLNLPAPVPDAVDLKTQSAVVTAVLKEHNEEENYVHEIHHDIRVTASEITERNGCDSSSSSPFHFSRLLMHQFNYFSWENRQEIELLERNEKLFRDIKNLDKRQSRETQKIAVFYVGPGQEDKHSILSNSQGSKKFEEFVAAMAWEVDLATHTGFMGGLEKNLSTGTSAPYFATHSLEVIFHVSTRLPGSEGIQLRHLGNDEIHIVWSEHQRDFRRGIINTEFGDVLIIIYPMKNNLYRIHIDRDPKIPPFGPLYDGVIIDGEVLPSLVRSTAINAGRRKRSSLPFFNRYYEERARCIQEIAQSRVHHLSFEEFSSRIFSPHLPEGNDEDIDEHDRTLHTSVPSQQNSSTQESLAVLKLLDIHDSTC